MNFVILASFAFAILILNGCGAIHNAQMSEIDKIQFGVASWYNNSFHGSKTASGEKYDKDDFTAAHRALPYGTIVKVTNIKNGRSVYVRINDRGPHKASRKIDMSYAAAKKIGMINDGIARVRLEVINDEFAFKLYEQQEKLRQIENAGIYNFGNIDTAYNNQKVLIRQFYKINKCKIIDLDINKIPLGAFDGMDDPPVTVTYEPSGSYLYR
ncbi:MAG: septal ring lytic transglycosylase RlpA family protein [Candidatus Poribacteria bacterium]